MINRLSPEKFLISDFQLKIMNRANSESPSPNMENPKNYPQYDFHGFSVITKLELVWEIPKGEFANI